MNFEISWTWSKEIHYDEARTHGASFCHKTRAHSLVLVKRDTLRWGKYTFVPNSSPLSGIYWCWIRHVAKLVPFLHANFFGNIFVIIHYCLLSLSLFHPSYFQLGLNTFPCAQSSTILKLFPKKSFQIKK